MAPAFSDDGRFLLTTGPRYAGIFVTDLHGERPPVTLTREAYLGWAAAWKGDAIRTWTRDGREVLFRDPTGKPDRVVTGRTATPAGIRGPVYESEDAIHLVRTDTDRVISEGDDRYYHPVLSPDGRTVVYEGLVTGIHVADIEHGTHAGPIRGNHPAWLPDSSGFVFDRVRDDGTRLVAGDLYLYRLSSGRVTRLTDTPDRIETHPAVSPDGRHVAFEADGVVYVGETEGLEALR